jgi:hypothetical protein
VAGLNETIIGVLGGRWRATVDSAGGIEPWDGSPRLDWHVAADDRWHTPSVEAAVRQRRIDGTPVVETRLRVPSGDAVHRVYCVADAGGLTIVEVENDSTLPFAVAFTRPDLLCSRPPTDVPVQGIDLPTGSIVVPVGHHATVRVALAHSSSTRSLPSSIPGPTQVARGWTTVVDRAGRLVLPDAATIEATAHERSELALTGPVDLQDDPVGYLHDAAQLVRLGEPADLAVPDVAEAVARVARRDHAWDVDAALDAATVVLAAAGEDRAQRDLARMRRPGARPIPDAAPPGRELVWREQRLARSRGDGTAELMAGGFPAAWLGANLEVYGLPVGPSSTVSFAIRWHGDRPAVLWELDGPLVPLRAPAVAPGWSTAEAKGEALWPRPAAAPSGEADISFS